jgi:DNA-binding NarL/FixJ family response regulator
MAALRQHAALVVAQVVPDAELYTASNGEEGLKLARSINPDLTIMDISMPEMNGIKAAQQIWLERPTAKILFWSQYHREAYVRELGKAVPDEAIHGYVLKSETEDKFAEAIGEVLLHDNPYIDPVVRGVQARLHSKDESLSDIEYETLLDIAVGLTDKAIAQRRHISVRGVQNRLSILIDKLVKGTSTYLKETSGMEVFNPRVRVVFEALKRGLLDPDEVAQLEKEAMDWLSTEFDSVT